jgi:hypothetical protein
MPKLRPIKDDAELAKVPLDEPVLVELEPAHASSAAVSEGDTDDTPLRSSDSDDGPGQLAEQLREAKDAAKRDREAREAAEQEARSAREEADRLRSSSADTEKELLSSSLEKAQQDRDNAKAEYVKAYELGDPVAMADAQEKIARAATDIRSYEGAIAEFEEGKKPAKSDHPVDLKTSVDRDPNLFPDERTWLKDHIEVLSDPRLNRKLGVAYDEAISKGFKRGSKGYFKFLDAFMGFNEQAQDDDNEHNERSTSVAAPVSRESRGNSGRPSVPTRIQLSPLERQTARDMGISDAAYAKGVQEREARRRADPAKYADR